MNDSLKKYLIHLNKSHNPGLVDKTGSSQIDLHKYLRKILDDLPYVCTNCIEKQFFYF